MFAFRNEYSSQASVNRTMERIPIKSGRKSSHSKLVSAIRFPEEHVFVSGSQDSTVKVWDCTSLSSITEVVAIESREGVSTLESVRLYGDGSVFLVGSRAGSLRLLDLRTRSGEGDKSIKVSTFAINTIGMGDSHLIVSGDDSGSVEVRDLRSLRTSALVSMNGSSIVTEQAVALSTKSISRQERVPVCPRVTEDMWAIAMGKAPHKRKLNTSPPDVPKDTSRTLFPTTPVQQAHNEPVILVQFIQPNKVLTVSKDRTVKQFSVHSGNIHDQTNLKEKPSAAAYFHRTLFLGDRGGVTSLHDKSGSFVRGERLENPHVGPVTALSSCAEWGLCTGGTDQHVFLYSLWNQNP